MEQLLTLAAHFTRHNDRLDLLLAQSTEPDPASHTAAAQDLATDTLAAIKSIHDQHLYDSADLSDAVVRLKQRAFLSTASATQNPRLAHELTALAPEAVLHSASIIAREGRKRRGATAVPPAEQLTAAQEVALREVAQGHIVVTGSADRQYVHSRTTRVLISTLRSLAAKNLITHTANSAQPAFDGGPPQDRVHLTAQGTTVLAPSLAFPTAPASSPGAAPRPATAAQPATARSR
ncbi:hypothetical protein AB0I84_12110 [Streptomyces spectabilis]|uniref:hypothetical protein n=1 Tax=Streptomyces spectabilis TaxID=68270 RepID=UPI0033DE4A9B